MARNRRTRHREMQQPRWNPLGSQTTRKATEFASAPLFDLQADRIEGGQIPAALVNSNT